MDAFVQEFTRRFTEDPEGAFVDLSYWGDASQADRRRMLNEFLEAYYWPDRSVTPRLVVDEMEVASAEGYEYGFTPDTEGKALQLQPTHILQVTAQLTSNSQVTDYIAVGERDGRFYFCTTKLP